MPNPSVSFRVPQEHLAAWQRIVLLLKALHPDDAARRLRQPMPDRQSLPAKVVTDKTTTPDRTGVRFMEDKLLAALGRWKLPVASAATSFLIEHGLPDTPENRCAAMVNAASSTMQRIRDEMEQVHRERRELQDDTASLCDELDRLQAERDTLQQRIAATKSRLARAQADLQAAQTLARRDFDEGRRRQLQRLVAENYRLTDIRAVIDAAHALGISVPDLPGFCSWVAHVGGMAQVNAQLMQQIRIWETYLAHLQREAERTKAMLSERAVESARELTRLRIEPQEAVHRSLQEAMEILASLTPPRFGSGALT